MHLGTLSIKGFRSYRNVTLRFDPALTTLVGENNVGKSTVWQAIQRLLLVQGIGSQDYPYGVTAPVSLAIDITLSDGLDQRTLDAAGKGAFPLRCTPTVQNVYPRRLGHAPLDA